MFIVISSGHGKYVRGASGYLDEVDEARRVVNRVADLLRAAGVETIAFHDNVSTTQSENLDTIVNFHNDQGPHDLDVSVHFNAYETTSKPMGTEVLYVTQEALAGEVASELASALDLPDRGGKYRSDLAFLNGTREPAILIETCFVDSSVDAQHYRDLFEAACEAIAETIGNINVDQPPEPIPPPDAGLLPLARFTGPCSWFGGPDDDGVTADEGLAFIYAYDEAPHLFLPENPPGSSGLARRLNPHIFYVACRWDYDTTSKTALARPSVQALVRAHGRAFLAWPADWGPHEDTGRAADLSPGLMEALGVTTGDEVEVIYPAPV